MPGTGRGCARQCDCATCTSHDAGFASLLALGLIFCALSVTWLATDATLAARGASVLRRPRIRRTLDGCTGAVLVAFGIRLATE